VLPRDAVGKLHFIHLLVSSRSWLQPPENTPSSQMQTQAPTQDSSESPAGSAVPG